MLTCTATPSNGITEYVFYRDGRKVKKGIDNKLTVKHASIGRDDNTYACITLMGISYSSYVISRKLFLLFQRFNCNNFI